MSNELLGTYNFNENKLVFGTREIKGFEDGTEIVAERAEDSFTAKVGVGGEVTRSRSNNNLGTITFTLNEFSPSNRYLQDIMNADEATGDGVLPAKIIDKSNPQGEKASGTEAWITKPASKSKGRESGPREWVIQVANLKME